MRELAQPLEEHHVAMGFGEPIIGKVAVLRPERVLVVHDLTNGQPHAPSIHGGTSYDGVLSVICNKACPFWRAIGRREGDLRVCGLDVVVDASATINIDDLQATIEEHDIVRLHVEVHEALRMQASGCEDDCPCKLLDNSLGSACLLLPLVMQEVLEAALGKLRDHVEQTIIRIGSRLAAGIPRIVQQLHEKVCGASAVELLVPKVQVRGGLKWLLQLLQNLDLPLVLLQGRLLGFSTRGLLAIELDRNKVANFYVLCLVANAESALTKDGLFAREYPVPSRDERARTQS
mmetsp:Transcript_86855/g.219090  ORF Transcript_86855/g.219090 Transcript_86855/m.219090 type:complete len:290 (+) Transcript_86855:442-1311(+)